MSGVREAASSGTRAAESFTREEVEDFLYEEAALLDEWRLDEWVDLFTEDCRYVVPSNNLPEGNSKEDLVLIDDDIFRLRARGTRLKSRHAHREYPHARTRHLVSNVRITDAEGENIGVSAAFMVWRFRDQGGEKERATYYVGLYEYRLAVVEGTLKIRYKRAMMDMSTLRAAEAVSIPL